MQFPLRQLPRNPEPHRVVLVVLLQVSPLCGEPGWVERERSGVGLWSGRMQGTSVLPPTPTSSESIDDSDSGERGLLLPVAKAVGGALTLRVKTVYDAKEWPIEVASAQASVGEVG